jgi:hypothetical protein
MKHVQLFGLASLTGGLLFAGINVIGALGIAQGASAVFGLLGVVLLLALTGGPLGLLVLRAAGSGRTGRVGLIGALITLLGLFSYLVGVLYTSLIDTAMGIFYALGALLSAVGMLPLGIAVLMVWRLPGWRRSAPLLVGLYFVLMIPIQIVFFIGTNGELSGPLLAGWGLTWVLLGYAIYSAAREERELEPAQPEIASEGAPS